MTVVLSLCTLLYKQKVQLAQILTVIYVYVKEHVNIFNLQHFFIKR